MIEPQDTKILTFHVINEDDKVVNGIQPLIGNTITNRGMAPTTLLIGNWEPMSMMNVRSIAAKNNRTVLQETINYMKTNKGAQDSQNENSSDIILYYETARDFLAESAYIFSLKTVFVNKYLALITPKYLLPNI